MNRQEILRQIQEQSRFTYAQARKNAIHEAVLNNPLANAAAAGAAASGGGPSSTWIELALANMNERYAEVTDFVPNRYNFWDDYIEDEGTPILTGINDGGDDMYDGGNFMNTNLTANWEDIRYGQIDGDFILESASILYTHTQASNEDDNEEYNNPPMDGTIELGDSYFGSGSKYFTNMYPGLFLMIADNISVSEFNISGNVGSDGDGVGAGYVESVIPNWTLFYKTNMDDSGDDPSINQLILVPGSSAGITHEFDTSAEDDDHRISGIDDRNRIIYAVVARNPGDGVLAEQDAVLAAQKILEIVSPE